MTAITLPSIVFLVTKTMWPQFNEHVLTEVPPVHIAHFTAWLQLCKVGVSICILQMVEMRFKEFKKLTWHLTGWKWWIWDLGFTLELKLLHYCQWFMYQMFIIFPRVLVFTKKKCNLQLGTTGTIPTWLVTLPRWRESWIMSPWASKNHER